MTITEKLAKLDADETAVRAKFNPDLDSDKVNYVYPAGVSASEIITRRVNADPITQRDKRTVYDKWKVILK